MRAARAHKPNGSCTRKRQSRGGGCDARRKSISINSCPWPPLGQTYRRRRSRGAERHRLRMVLRAFHERKLDKVDAVARHQPLVPRQDSAAVAAPLLPSARAQLGGDACARAPHDPDDVAVLLIKQNDVDDKPREVLRGGGAGVRGTAPGTFPKPCAARRAKNQSRALRARALKARTAPGSNSGPTCARSSASGGARCSRRTSPGTRTSRARARRPSRRGRRNTARARRAHRYAGERCGGGEPRRRAGGVTRRGVRSRSIHRAVDARRRLARRRVMQTRRDVLRVRQSNLDVQQDRRAPRGRGLRAERRQSRRRRGARGGVKPAAPAAAVAVAAAPERLEAGVCRPEAAGARVQACDARQTTRACDAHQTRAVTEHNERPPRRPMRRWWRKPQREGEKGGGERRDDDASMHLGRVRRAHARASAATRSAAAGRRTVWGRRWRRRRSRRRRRALARGGRRRRRGRRRSRCRSARGTHRAAAPCRDPNGAARGVSQLGQRGARGAQSARHRSTAVAMVGGDGPRGSCCHGAPPPLSLVHRAAPHAQPSSRAAPAAPLAGTSRPSTQTSSRKASSARRIPAGATPCGCIVRA